MDQHSRRTVGWVSLGERCTSWPRSSRRPANSKGFCPIGLPCTLPQGAAVKDATCLVAHPSLIGLTSMNRAFPSEDIPLALCHSTVHRSQAAGRATPMSSHRGRPDEHGCRARLPYSGCTALDPLTLGLARESSVETDSFVPPDHLGASPAEQSRGACPDNFAPPLPAGAPLISVSYLKDHLVRERDKEFRQMANHRKAEFLAARKNILCESRPREKPGTSGLMSLLFSCVAEICVASSKFKMFVLQIPLFLMCAAGAEGELSETGAGALGIFPWVPPMEFLIPHFSLYVAVLLDLFFSDGFEKIYEFRFGKSTPRDLVVAKLRWAAAATVTLGFGVYAYLVWMGLGRLERWRTAKKLARRNQKRPPLN